MSLRDVDAMATLAVKDLGAAKTFYGETLGLQPLPEGGPGVASFKSGNSTIVVYESEYAGTNRATAVTFRVDDAESVVNELKAKGVGFERYDLPGLERRGDLHVHGSFKGAWLKDPDGNIIHVLSMA
jgi:catechol-2,3-dioxygenase